MIIEVNRIGLSKELIELKEGIDSIAVAILLTLCKFRTSRRFKQ